MHYFYYKATHFEKDNFDEVSISQLIFMGSWLNCPCCVLYIAFTKILQTSFSEKQQPEKEKKGWENWLLVWLNDNSEIMFWVFFLNEYIQVY